MNEQYLLAIDQGTTGTKIIFLDSKGQVVSEGYQKHTQIYPQQGWVEHDPEEIWDKVVQGVSETMKNGGIQPEQVAGIGLDNQGETCLFWDAETTRSFYNAVVWSCKRSTSISDKWNKDGDWPDKVTYKTGLKIDPYYSATKFRWMMDEVPEVKRSLHSETLRCSTLDSWFIYKMTAGKSYFTDSSTASRTLLFNIRNNEWDDDILNYLNVKKEWLPRVLNSVDHYGMTDPKSFCGIQAPILVNMMDQAASLYGHLCIEKGMSKCTYGTGCFIYMNTEQDIYSSAETAIDTTVVWSREGQLTYCLDSSVPSAGSIIEWGQNIAELYSGVPQLQEWSEAWFKQATEAELDYSVMFIPAFTGLGTPYWDSNVRGSFLGLSHFTDKKVMARAILEGIAHSVADCFTAIEKAANQPISLLKVDGGLTNNPYLMQFQADLIGVPVHVQAISNTTTMGLGFLVGEACKWWTVNDLQKMTSVKQVYDPMMNDNTRQKLRQRWNTAIQSLIDFHQKLI